MIFLILFIIGCVVFFGYTIFIEHYIGIENLPSLSQSYYELEKKKKSYRYIFSDYDGNRNIPLCDCDARDNTRLLVAICRVFYRLLLSGL